MKSTKVLFLFFVFSWMSSLLSNVVVYLGSSEPEHDVSILVLFFGIYSLSFAQFTKLPEIFVIFCMGMSVGMYVGSFALIINVVVQAMVRIWRPFKTLFSFYIPISLIPSPLIMSWWINGYVNVSSVFSSFTIFVYTSWAMMLVRSTLRRHTRINPNETGMCVHMSVVLVNWSFSYNLF